MKEEKKETHERLLDVLSDRFIEIYIIDIKGINLDRLRILSDYDWKQEDYDKFLEKLTYEEQRYILEKVQEKLKENENE